MRLERKINKEKQTNKHQQQQQQQQQEEQASKQKKQQTNRNNRKSDTLPTQSIFPKDFSQVVYLFLSQKFIIKHYSYTLALFISGLKHTEFIYK